MLRQSKQKFVTFIKWWVTFFNIFIFAIPCFAVDAALTQLPSAFDAGQAGKYIRSIDIPRDQSVLQPSIKPAIPSPSSIPQADKIKLTLTKVILVGNTIFNTKELEAIFAPSLNKTISLADLQNLIEQVTKKYREEGYILSRAILPPQKIQNGVVTVQIIEGFISQAKIEGNAGSSLSLLKEYEYHVIQSKPLKLEILEKEMLLANDLPGLTVKAVLTPSKEIPAAADLTLYTERQLLNGYFIYDNYGSRFLGPREIAFGGNINSWLLPGDSNALHFANTTQHEQMQFSEFVHSQPVNSIGTLWTLGTNYTQTRPGFILEAAEIVGRSFSIYSLIEHSLIRSRSKNLKLRAGANYQNVNSTILGFPFYQDRFRSLGVGFYFDTIDSWKGLNNIQLDVAHGFPIMGANMHTLQSRPFGVTIFTKANLTAGRLQPLIKRTSLYLGVIGQYAFNPQLATQQFSFGGAQYGRGYEPSEIVGDRGLGTKLELRWDTNPELRFLQSVEYYAFYDAGVVWNINTVGQPGKLSATSTGLGARLNLIPYLSGEIFLAKPLSRQVTTLQTIDENSTQARIFFQIIARV